METGKFCDNIRVIKMDSCLVLTEYLSRRFLRLSTSPIALIHSEKVSSSKSKEGTWEPWKFRTRNFSMTSEEFLMVQK